MLIKNRNKKNGNNEKKKNSFSFHVFSEGFSFHEGEDKSNRCATYMNYKPFSLMFYHNCSRIIKSFEGRHVWLSMVIIFIPKWI